MWLTERVWEPHLPKPLREAGVEYVLVDDHHFAVAGLDAERLGGYYLTEDGGASLAVFPISQRLRYLVPFADLEEVLAHLGERRPAGGLTLMDDGEKFGVWPGTRELVYEKRWLARFFEALLDAPWLEISTFSDYLDRFPPRGRAYLPTAAYREMEEWALPAEAASALIEAKDRLRSLPDGERLASLMRGGNWRNFLVKYPEIGDLYWKMLRLSRMIHEAVERRPADARLAEARLRLWRGQGNDAYWHGIFGGCYLPHLRRGVRQALISAERCLSGASSRWTCDDINGDGRTEIALETPTLSLVLNPECGGSLTEMVYAPKELELADVFGRRPEAYHARVKPAASGAVDEVTKTIHDRFASKENGLESRLAYDRFRRASLLDGFFSGTGPLDALEPWPLALLCLGDRRMMHRVGESHEYISIDFYLENPDRWPLVIKKQVRVRLAAPEFHVSYTLGWSGSASIQGRWGVQWNLALTAGEAPGRFYRLLDRPSLGSRGEAGDSSRLELVDEWADCSVALAWGRPAHASWAPVETVSSSETGFERIYQGSSVLLAWPVSLAPGGEWAEEIVVAIRGARSSEHAAPSNPR
jgi:alpha-amylase